MTNSIESHENLIVGVVDRFHAAALVQKACGMDAELETSLAAHNNLGISSLNNVKEHLSEDQLEGYKAIGCRATSKTVLPQESFTVSVRRRFAAAAVRPDWRRVIPGIASNMKREKSDLTESVMANSSKFRGVSSGLLLGFNLIAFSSPESKPLVYGFFALGGIAIASEVVALKAIGVDKVEEMSAGEIVEFAYARGSIKITSLEIID